MLFSEFADIMYKHCGGSQKTHEYLLFLFDTIMREPETDAERKKYENDKYNPFASLKPDTLDRLFHGTNHMNQKKTHTARTLASTDKFAAYIDSLSWDAQDAIETEFKKRILNFNQNDALGYACADLFLQIMDDIYEGNETPSPILCIPNLTATSKLPNIPAASVYYDDRDGKIHIGKIEIAIPKELEPPTNIAPEEEIYVRELLAAYADAELAGTFTQVDLDFLPQKYKRNFSDQRINYYSAVRIDRFVRESIAEGEVEMQKWKKGTFGYIKDTLWDDYDDAYKRLIAVMKKVVDSDTTSVVSSFKNLIGAKEKKGACHLLVNDGEINWVEKNE